MSFVTFFTTLALVSFVFTACGQPPQGNGVDGEAFNPVNPQSQIALDREGQICNRRFRTFDGSCTNNINPLGQLFGSAGRPQFSYFGHRNTESVRDSDLPSPRLISNMLAKQNMDKRESRDLNEMVTFFGQFIDHTIVATPVNDGGDKASKEPFFIDVPDDDPILANITGAQLQFVRSKRVFVSGTSKEQRPINTLSSVFDLASVYGPSTTRAKALRTFSEGLMRTGNNNLLPKNSKRLSNNPTSDPKFFVAGDARSNEHPVLTSLHTIFLREHNDIARELKGAFSKFDDEELFQNARQINIAQFQRIVFDEWYPAITGENLLRYNGFVANIDPTVSTLFSTAAFRVGHTLVNNMVTRLGQGNGRMPGLKLVDVFFSSTKLIVKENDVDPFLRGALRTQAQEIDLMVVDALRNFLFTDVVGEIGLDLVAMNLQRGRDHGLPPYNILRGRFGRGGRAKNFREVTKNRNVQSALQTVYGSVDKIDAWIGLMAEDHVIGSSMGATMLGIWSAEFKRLRNGDRFYYENRKQYDPNVLERIPRLKALFNGKDIFRAVLLRNTDIDAAELPSRMFFTNRN